MGNGKPGDHPVNDILDHDLRVFSPEIDEMVREIARLVPRYRMWDMFNWHSPPPVNQFEKQVRELLDRLRTEARDRGWELPDSG
jgi:hypothetical protein